MTYCVGLKLDSGLVFASDSRTNAGVDYVTTVSKMHVFDSAPDRIFIILSAGNLANTGELMNYLKRDLAATDGRVNLNSCQFVFEVAEYVGRLSQQIQQMHAPSLAQAGISGEVTLILGGQIQGQPHEMYMIYAQGNYISAGPETPYLQIGESKYGKPGLDRIVDYHMPLDAGARLVLVSLDATARSNITVGPPFEVAVSGADTIALTRYCRFEQTDPYLGAIQTAWNEGIRQAFANLPALPWEAEGMDSAGCSYVPEPVDLKSVGQG
ncbi:MAG: 20S proteasome subunit A/B [Chromatiales bacterium]|nr:20S proteasome subunit A/B [Chromatiales bacterium]